MADYHVWLPGFIALRKFLDRTGPIKSDEEEKAMVSEKVDFLATVSLFSHLYRVS
jgi:hypothetical protein